jgi:hypothetical protein
MWHSRGMLVTKDHSRRVLRRRSWLLITLVPPVPMIMIPPWVMVRDETASDPAPWMAQAVALMIAVVLWRLGTCRIVLGREKLTVHNPLKSYSADYSGIASVSGGPAQALVINLIGGKGIHSVAFGGSIVDLLFKSTPRAAEEIWDRVPKRRPHRSDHEARVTRSLRPCLPADIALGLSAAALLVAAVLAL